MLSVWITVCRVTRERQERTRTTTGIALVTGATSGIGLEMARALLQAGYRVHIPCRDMKKGERVQNELQQHGQVVLYQCDLSSIRQVRRFTQEFKSRNDHLDILINNAGNYQPTFVTSEDGVESHMAVHVVAPFIITNELLPLLERSSEGARIINTTSALHGIVNNFKLTAFTSRAEFSRIAGYANAKYALNLMTKQWALNWRDRKVSVNAVHPGLVLTDISREDPLGDTLLSYLLVRLAPWGVLNARQGAVTVIWAALATEMQDVTGRQLHDLAEEPMNPMVEKDFEAGRGEALLEYIANLVASRSR